ncbi:MAG: sugar phosphate isomerase/epimerase, partial [Anaerolineales bacterium]|nr:sugar phosphate isomerase/epimerase [Anaerolineales bacterium]
VKAILDTYWVQHGGADSVDWVHRLAGRMDVIHLKDMVIQERQQVMAEVGQGNLNWPGILAACAETGVAYAAVEQDICQRDPFESMAMSYN